MQTTVNKVNDVEFELEINASAEDLSSDLDQALRTQKGRTTMKGFRPGHVPISLVKKIHGKSLAYGVAEHTVQKTYEDEVLKSDEYDVLGQPTITDLDYEYEGALRAVVRFGIRPEIELKDLSSETVYRLQHEVSDEDVEKELENMRSGRAELIPDDGPVSEDSVVIADMQRLDTETLTAIVGEKQEGVSILMSDENVLPRLKDGLLGKSAGDSFNSVFPGPGEDDEDRTYLITVVAVKRQELPDLDEDLVAQITSERLSSVEDLTAEVRKQLEDGWQKRGKELFESDVIAKIVELYDFLIPESVVDMYLDAFVSDLKSQGNGELPPQFDEEQFRSLRKEEAKNQAKWMFVRDKIIADQDLAVTDEDRDAFFEQTAGEGMDLDMLKQYYNAVPNMAEQLDQRLLTDKVFNWMSEKFIVEDKDLESYRELSNTEESET